MAKHLRKKRSSPQAKQATRISASEVSSLHFWMSHWKQFLSAAVIIAVGLWTYWPALHGDWLWDDDTMLTHNLDLRTLNVLGRIWLMASSTDWPLTWTIFWGEWHIFGGHPFGYH